LAKEQNPAQHKLHQPYYEGEPTEADTPITSSSEPKPQPVTPPAPGGTSKKTIEVFFSYAHEDEKLRDQLEKHLKLLQRDGVITTWHDREITAGSEWAGQIDQRLNSADIILLLISADFMASDYCHDVELKRAIERHEANEAVVIPIIVRPVDWTGASFSKLQALPKNAKPITRWPDRDEAWLNVAQGIRKVAEKLANP
jgi:hypothetical protein